MWRRKSLAVNIIAVFMVFNILSIVFFSLYVQKSDERESIKYARESSLEVIKEKGELISLAFEHIKNRTESIGMYMEDNLKQSVSSGLSPEYLHLDDGTITRIKDSNKTDLAQSNIIVPNTTPLSKELIREINLTEGLDKYFEQISETEDTTWCYIVTKENLLRCSPYSNLNNFFASDHSQISDIFYTQAGDKNNPEHKAIWTSPYYDYLGTGWTMTCSQPVYENDGELFGVICLDMSINKIKEKYFNDFSLGESGKICWMSNEGQMYYHTDFDNITAEQGEIFEKNIFDTDISNDKEKILRNYVLKGGSGIKIFVEDGKETMLVYTQITNNDSVLFMQIDMSEFSALYDSSLNGLRLIVFFDVILAIIFAVILYKRFSKPMNKLIKQAERITEGNYASVHFEDETQGIYYEIIRLNQAFEAMRKSIELYTENLIDKNKEIHTILEAIDEGLMIVDLEGNVNLKSKEFVNIPNENLQKGIDTVATSKESMTEKIILGGEIYKNVYYPIIKSDDVSKIVVSSECITKTELMKKELQQIEKMAGVGQLSAAIVHELKNILAVIKGAAYILNITNENGKEEINTIQKAVDEAENVIRTLLDYSGRDRNGSEMIHIGTVINQILLLSKKEIIRKGITVKKNIDNECYVNSTSREAIKVILQNIILNAIQAVNFDGRIDISCLQNNEEVIVKIKDNGGGIKIHPKEKIFDPFISTKEDGNGIGLWITKKLMTSLNGEIIIDEPNKGETEFTLCIPTNRKEQEK